jgi:hypothetical protein
LVIPVIPPHHHSAIGAQRDTVILAGCNRDKIIARRRVGYLIIVIIPPRFQTAVGANRHIMIVTGGDRDKVSTRRGAGYLIIVIIPPRNNTPVGGQCDTVVKAGIDGREVIAVGRCRLAEILRGIRCVHITTLANDRALLLSKCGCRQNDD